MINPLFGDSSIITVMIEVLTLLLLSYDVLSFQWKLFPVAVRVVLSSEIFILKKSLLKVFKTVRKTGI